MTDYREHGTTGLSRDLAALYADDDPPPVNQAAVEHQARHARLVALHGKPERFDTTAALALAGLEGRYRVDDVVAFLHRDAASAAAFDASDREHNGNVPLAHVRHDGRILALTLLAGCGPLPEPADAETPSPVVLRQEWTPEDVERFCNAWTLLHAPRPSRRLLPGLRLPGRRARPRRQPYKPGCSLTRRSHSCGWCSRIWVSIGSGSPR